MNQKRTADAAALSNDTLLALACIAVWVTAAGSTSLFGIWLAIGVAAVALGTAVLVVDGTASRAILQPNRRLLSIGLAVGGVMTVATYLLYPMLSSVVPFMASDTSLLYSSFRTPSLRVAWFALAPVILGEELVWRGVVQAVAVRGVGTWRGVVLSAGPTRSPTCLSARRSWSSSRCRAGSAGARCVPRPEASYQPWWLTWYGTSSCCCGYRSICDERQMERQRADCARQGPRRRADWPACHTPLIAAGHQR